MAEKFITGQIDGEKFSAFVLYNKPPCEKGEHKWDGEEILTFHNDDRVLRQSEVEALPKSEQDKLSISSGQVSCSNCGMGYMEYDNPYLSED